MQGFGFLEFDDEMDAKEVVPGNYLPGCPTWSLLTTSQLSVFTHYTNRLYHQINHFRWILFHGRTFNCSVRQRWT
jgi:hypothetical protein